MRESVDLAPPCPSILFFRSPLCGRHRREQNSLALRHPQSQVAPRIFIILHWGCRTNTASQPIDHPEEIMNNFHDICVVTQSLTLLSFFHMHYYFPCMFKQPTEHPTCITTSSRHLCCRAVSHSFLSLMFVTFPACSNNQPTTHILQPFYHEICVDSQSHTALFLSIQIAGRARNSSSERAKTRSQS